MKPVAVLKKTIIASTVINNCRVNNPIDKPKPDLVENPDGDQPGDNNDEAEQIEDNDEE